MPLALGILGIVSATSAGTVELVSVNKEGTGSGNSSSGSPMISADGRLVVFPSYADDLVATDTNRSEDVFVRNLQNGTTTLVSVKIEGTDSANRNSRISAISTDGRFVVFLSDADDLVATDTNRRKDVFVRDLQHGTTTLVSVNKEGTDSGNGDSEHDSRGQVISANGRFVAFVSDADDLVSADTNGSRDVFVRDLQNGTTTLVSINKDGTDSGNNYSRYSAISADGRFVAFSSRADDLVSADTNGTQDVFVRDLQKGTTTLVSVNKDGTDSGNNYSYLTAISADGRFVAFSSNADDLVSADTNGMPDVFVRDLQNGTTTLVSVNKDGTDSGASTSGGAAISADGRFVTFASYAGDLVTTDTNGRWDVFVRDLLSGTTTLVSVNKGGTDSGAGTSYIFAISADGRFVAFASYANDLVTTDTNGSRDVFVRDLLSGTTSLVSINKEGTDSGNGPTNFPVISANGRVVAFESAADDLVATDITPFNVFAYEAFEAPQVPLPKSLNIDPSHVNVGEKAYGVVALSHPAPASGVPLSLHSTNPAVATVPNKLMIPAGSTSGSFVVNTGTNLCSSMAVRLSATRENTTVADFLNVAADSRRPSKPTGFKKFVFKNKRLILSWDSMPDVEKFVIYRKKARQAWKTLDEVTGGQTIFTPPLQTPCVAYQYRLRAVNHCGSSTAASIGHLYDNGSCPF